MKIQTDINNASEPALMRDHLKLVDNTARERDEVTLVREELHAPAAKRPTRYENLRRWEQKLALEQKLAKTPAILEPKNIEGR